MTFVSARQLGALRRLTSGLISPLPNTLAVSKARARTERLRDDLRDVLRKGFPAREALLLDPLLEEYDGVELAAAALVLLDRERMRQAEAAAAVPAPVATPVAATGNGNWPRLYVNIGERDGARAGDLVGAITGEGEDHERQIGDGIEVRDTHSWWSCPRRSRTPWRCADGRDHRGTPGDGTHRSAGGNARRPAARTKAFH